MQEGESRDILGQAQGDWGLVNFTSISGMGHLISELKFKIPNPLPPTNFWQVPNWEFF